MSRAHAGGRAGETPRVLFVGPHHEDYLADSLLHGLRTELDGNVVDTPKAEHLYVSADRDMLARMYGHGFTLYGLLPDVPMDRSRLWPRLVEGEFDLVVFGNIRDNFGVWAQWGQLHALGITMAVLDGADEPNPYPYGPQWWSVPAWWFLFRAHNRARYFKREITPATRWWASFLLLPPAIGRQLGIRPISFSIPAEKVVVAVPPKDKDFPCHVVDPEGAARLGTTIGHAFTEEGDYYEDLQRSRFGITTRRAGWDALRHYEIAANGAVPCFRDLRRKPPQCAPHGLDQTNCGIYADADDLFHQVSRMDDSTYSQLAQGALTWVRTRTTVAQAQEFLAACGFGFAPVTN